MGLVCTVIRLLWSFLFKQVENKISLSKEKIEKTVRQISQKNGIRMRKRKAEKGQMENGLELSGEETLGENPGNDLLQLSMGELS